MSPQPNDDYLERIKAGIRADAELARVRDPLPRRAPPPVRPSATRDDGIERERLDYTLGELSGPHYRAFIDHAFRALLKRAPDDAGSETQIRLLAGGAGKVEVLGNLRWSPEGKHIGARVRGLLPRYVLAKLTRVPLLGYCLEWGIACAGLPMLLRHQRASDTSVAARFGEVADTQRAHADAQREQAQRLADLAAEHERSSEAIRADVQRMLLRLDDLERRAAKLEARCDADARETIELRHLVHTTNHWLTSLQRSLGELDDAADAERERADALLAAIIETAEQAATRRTRHAAWAAALAAHVHDGGSVLDLGSGDGTWLEALAANGIEASGVEANRALVARAQQRGRRVALGDPLTALTRCPDARLDAITLVAPAVATGAGWLAESLRALAPGGWLLLRGECEPGRTRAADTDPQHWLALLAAAGFTSVAPLAGDNGAVLAQRSAA